VIEKIAIVAFAAAFVVASSVASFDVASSVASSPLH
jgi:hypothetical protein